MRPQVFQGSSFGPTLNLIPETRLNILSGSFLPDHLLLISCGSSEKERGLISGLIENLFWLVGCRKDSVDNKHLGLVETTLLPNTCLSASRSNMSGVEKNWVCIPSNQSFCLSSSFSAELARGWWRGARGRSGRCATSARDASFAQPRTSDLGTWTRNTGPDGTFRISCTSFISLGNFTS